MGTASLVASSIIASASSTLAGISRTGPDTSSNSAVDATLPISLSSVIFSTPDLPQTTNPVDVSPGVHDEL